MTQQRRRTIHKAVSSHKGKKIFPYRISENVIELTRWKDKVSPEDFPSEFSFPKDISKAVLYDERQARNPTKPISRSKQKRVKDNSEEAGRDKDGHNQVLTRGGGCICCRKTASTISTLCKCTTTPWNIKNTEHRIQQHIDLRWVDDTHGVGVYALTSFKKGGLLGEYVGEPVSDVEASFESRYLFGIEA